MVKKVLNTIKEHSLISDHSDIVLGLSGGPDSLALFYVLVEESEKRDWIIHPVHVNHKLRPGDAEEDQKFVEDLCYSLYESTSGRVRPCTTFVVDCNRLAEINHMTCEEAGREIRYESFADTASKLKTPERETVIAVAQNANDQAETILFRIIRGTGVDGLGGISYERTDEYGFRIVRPILDCTRAEIEEYLASKGIEPRRDKTNDEPVYTRNKIRLQLIPYLEKEFNPNIVNTLNRLGSSAREDSEFLISEAGKRFTTDIRELAEMPKALRYRVYQKALSEIGMRENITTKYLESIDRIRVSQNHKRAYTELNGGYRVAREKHNLVFYKE